MKLPKMRKKTFFLVAPLMYVLTNIFLVMFVGIILSLNNKKETIHNYLPTTIYSLFSLQPPVLGATDTNIEKVDARAELINKALARYNCPIGQKGEVIVEYGDKYGVDPFLIYAISQQESNCGRNIPKNSYNAWGWAVFTGQQRGTEFDSWEHAIEVVTRGIRRNYYDVGLVEPCQIMIKYTPSSYDKGSPWCRSVNFFINQAKSGEL